MSFQGQIDNRIRSYRRIEPNDLESLEAQFISISVTNKEWNTLWTPTGTGKYINAVNLKQSDSVPTSTTILADTSSVVALHKGVVDLLESFCETCTTETFDTGECKRDPLFVLLCSSLYCMLNAACAICDLHPDNWDDDGSDLIRLSIIQCPQLQSFFTTSAELHVIGEKMLELVRALKPLPYTLSVESIGGTTRFSDTFQHNLENDEPVTSLIIFPGILYSNYVICKSVVISGELIRPSLITSSIIKVVDKMFAMSKKCYIALEIYHGVAGDIPVNELDDFYKLDDDLVEMLGFLQRLSSTTRLKKIIDKLLSRRLKDITVNGNPNRVRMGLNLISWLSNADMHDADFGLEAEIAIMKMLAAADNLQPTLDFNRSILELRIKSAIKILKTILNSIQKHNPDYVHIKDILQNFGTSFTNITKNAHRWTHVVACFKGCDTLFRESDLANITRTVITTATKCLNLVADETDFYVMNELVEKARVRLDNAIIEDYKNLEAQQDSSDKSDSDTSDALDVREIKTDVGSDQDDNDTAQQEDANLQETPLQTILRAW